MKKFSIYLVLFMLAISCTNTKVERQREHVKQLQQQKEILIVELQQTQKEIYAANQTLHELQNTISTHKVISGAYSSDRVPIYILELELSQGHISLDLGKHIKDAINKITFTIPVSEEFFNTVYEGQMLTKSFRFGSFIMEGSAGNWKIKVVDKIVQQMNVSLYENHHFVVQKDDKQNIIISLKENDKSVVIGCTKDKIKVTFNPISNLVGQGRDQDMRI